MIVATLRVTVALVAFSVALLITGWVRAEIAGQPPAQPMPTPTAKTIFDYKAELNLSDKQANEIRDILGQLNKEIQLNGARMTILNFELDDLMTKNDASPEDIRNKLKEQCELQVNSRFADLMATHQINKKVLTPAQLDKWRSIQAAARSTNQ